jgi:hypothetical protein
MIGWLLFTGIAWFIIGVCMHGEIIKDYARNHNPYIIDGEIYYIEKKE